MTREETAAATATATATATAAAPGSVASVRATAALEAVVTPEGAGSVWITATVADTEGATADAQVQVRVFATQADAQAYRDGTDRDVVVTPGVGDGGAVTTDDGVATGTIVLIIAACTAAGVVVLVVAGFARRRHVRGSSQRYVAKLEVEHGKHRDNGLGGGGRRGRYADKVSTVASSGGIGDDGSGSGSALQSSGGTGGGSADDAGLIAPAAAHSYSSHVAMDVRPCPVVGPLGPAPVVGPAAVAVGLTSDVGWAAISGPPRGAKRGSVVLAPVAANRRRGSSLGSLDSDLNEVARFLAAGARPSVTGRVGGSDGGSDGGGPSPSASGLEEFAAGAGVPGTDRRRRASSLGSLGSELNEVARFVDAGARPSVTGGAGGSDGGSDDDGASSSGSDDQEWAAGAGVPGTDRRDSLGSMGSELNEVERFIAGL